MTMDFDPPGSGDPGYWGTVQTFHDARKRLASRTRTPATRANEVLEAMVANSVRGLLDDTGMQWMIGAFQ